MVGDGLGLETELRLGLPGGDGCKVEKNEKKRVFSDISSGGGAAESKNRVVVGWPPVAAYRRKNSFGRAKMYVKVSMDGAPYLRKIDLSVHRRYSDLVAAFEELFGCFSIDGDNSEWVRIYEDKDGDWMVLGDVPWEMFLGSCIRLRIMKKSDAKVIGLTKEEVRN